MKASLTREDAITRVEPSTLDQLLHPTLDPKAKPAPLATGLPASPGAASGEIVFSADEAQALRQTGRKIDPGAGRDLALRTFMACMPPRAS